MKLSKLLQQMVFYISLITLLTGCATPGRTTVSTETPPSLPTSSPTFVPTPQPTVFPIAAGNWKGVTISNLCLNVISTYPKNIRQEDQKPFADEVHAILTTLNIPVSNNRVSCDAFLTFALHFENYKHDYTGGSGFPSFPGHVYTCYAGVIFNGFVTIAMPGRDPFYLDLSQKKDIPNKIEDCFGPDQMNLDLVNSFMQRAVKNAAGSIWGLPVMKQLADTGDPDFHFAYLGQLINDEKYTDAIPDLINLLNKNDRTFLYFIESYGPWAQDVVPALINSIERNLGSDADWVGNSLDILGSIGPTQADAVPTLLKILADPREFNLLDLRFPNIHYTIIQHTYIAAEAAEALRKIGANTSDVATALKSVVNDKNRPYEVRMEAAITLEKIDPKLEDALQFLRQTLTSPCKTFSAGCADEDHFMALRGLAELGQDDPKRVQPLLTKALQDKGLVFPAAAILSHYDLLTEKDLPFLLKTLAEGQGLGNEEEISMALASIQPIDSKTFVALGDFITQNYDSERNRECANGCGHDDATFPVRGTYVLKTLSQLGSDASKAVPSLVTVLEKGEIYYHDWYYLTLATTLGKIGTNSPEAIAALIDATQRDTPWEAYAAGDGLIYARSSAIPPLISALQDNHYGDKTYILMALVALTGQNFGPDPSAWSTWWQTQQ